jgi:ElaB/YqjD/DUF883 family membrane-anchored ribosome-binding protein
MNTPSHEYPSNGPASSDRPEAIARAIDQTRDEVDETLDALQAKLSPGQMLDQAVAFVRDNGGEFANNLGRSVRDNPLPVLLTGVGLLWLMSGPRPSRPSPAQRRGSVGSSMDFGRLGQKISSATSEAVSETQERFAGVTDSVSDAASTAASKASDGIARASDTVRAESQHISEVFSHFLQEQPVLVGAIGVAVGALLGYALPATDVEERVLGESRGATPPSANAANDSANAANEQLASRPASAGPDDPVNPCKTD